MPHRHDQQPGSVSLFKELTKSILKAPIQLYRWTLKPLVGWPCRHLPTCSEYALDAIDKNGAWRGFWLTASRMTRCHPWGTHGFDPAPDIRHERHPFAPWLYGRWTMRQMMTGKRAGAQPPGPDAGCRKS